MEVSGVGGSQVNKQTIYIAPKSTNKSRARDITPHSPHRACSEAKITTIGSLWSLVPERSNVGFLPAKARFCQTWFKPEEKTEFPLYITRHNTSVHSQPRQLLFKMCINTNENCICEAKIMKVNIIAHNSQNTESYKF